MSLENIVEELRSQRSQLDQAIAALQGTLHVGRPRKAGGRQRLRMSAATRARIGAAKQAWWAKQKRNSSPAKGQPRIMHATKRKPMSSATRKKLSRLMKARW